MLAFLRLPRICATMSGAYAIGLALVIGIGLFGTAPVLAAERSASQSPLSCSQESAGLVRTVFPPESGIGLDELCRPIVTVLTVAPEIRNRSLRINLDSLPEVGAMPFYGLASFYNYIQSYRIRAGKLTDLASVAADDMRATDWVVFAGRYDAFVLRAPKAKTVISDGVLTLTWPKGTAATVEAVVAPKGQLATLHQGWTNATYAHLWAWLAGLSRAVEYVVRIVHRLTGFNWGWSILVFACLVKLALLPASLLTVRFQRQVSSHQAALAPQLAEIKATLKGEEAHKRTMAAYKDQGITPFFALKPMIGSAIQIPFLIAIFAALGDMPELAGSAFLWIDDLSYPDTVATLGFVIPWLGDRISLLPFIMSGVSALSGVFYHDSHAPPAELARQKRNLYLMAIGFFLLFYPFPAALVYYWMLANVLQIVQQKLVKL